MNQLLDEIVDLTIVLTGFMYFVYLLMQKWSIFDLYEVHSAKWMPKSICKFCFFFWSGVIFTLSLYGMQSILFYLAPASAAAFVTFIINERANFS